MADGTVYLDVDDEITSAAARIRSSASPKVAIVVPYGSRIATSRMNFRLLSREAVVNNRRLSVVAGDPATRALAASAGLPVFATVAEYDAAIAGPKPTAEADADLASIVAPPAPPATTATAPSTEAAEPTESAEPPSGPGPRSKRRRAAAAGSPAGPVTDETVVIPVPAPAAVQPPAAAAAPRSATSRDRPGLDGGPARGPAAPAGSATTAAPARVPVLRSRRRFELRAPILAIAAVAVLALLVAGVGAYLLLPSATIAVTPRQEAIGPISLTVRADPDATAVDLENAVVPADRIDIPVEASQTFTTTGRRVVEEAATGQVVFSSYNTAQTNTIPAGSIVSTEGGIQFRTAASVSLPPARIVPPLQIAPSSATVAVEAVSPGTAGNVPANAITVVPRSENPDLTKVRNPDATAGGEHEEFPQVSQAEVDAALAALRAALEAAFAESLAGGAGAPAGMTVFPDTGLLGEGAPTTDPATLVGQEVATFDLGMTASGSVIAVDETPIASIAEARLRSNVGAGFRLVEDSIRIEPGDGTVTAGEVTFPVSARAARIPLLDPAELIALVKGRSVDDARQALEAYGTVEIETWPDWVTTVTTIDARISLEIVGQDGPGGEADATPDPDGDATPDPDATLEPDTDPSGSAEPS
jgi:hypothetical protein